VTHAHRAVVASAGMCRRGRRARRCRWWRRQARQSGPTISRIRTSARRREPRADNSARSRSTCLKTSSRPFANPGGVVPDPVVVGGTTSVAALNLGRRDEHLLQVRVPGRQPTRTHGDRDQPRAGPVLGGVDLDRACMRGQNGGSARDREVRCRCVWSPSGSRDRPSWCGCWRPGWRAPGSRRHRQRPRAWSGRRCRRPATRVTLEHPTRPRPAAALLRPSGGRSGAGSWWRAAAGPLRRR